MLPLFIDPIVAGVCRMFRIVVSGLVATVAGAGLSVPLQQAYADALVIASKSPNIRAGSILPDDRTLELSAGETVTMLMADGRTRTITGPFAQPVASFSKGRPADDTLWTSVAASLQKSTARQRTGAARSGEPVGSGGSGPEVRRYATAPARNAAASAPAPAEREPAVQSFSWLHVPIHAEGDYCIQKGSDPVLVRGVAVGDQSATVIDVRAGTRAHVIFAAGSATAAWPDRIKVTTGPYALQLPQSAARQIRLRVIDPLPQADETLRLLHSQRCQAQIEAWLRGVATANR